MAAAYRLAPHVHACLSGAHVVLLDLRKDRYLAVNAADAAGLRLLVDDWPGVEHQPINPNEPERLLAAQSAAASMLAEKLIIPADTRAGVVDIRTRLPLPAPARPLFDQLPQSEVRLRAKHLTAFSCAVMLSKLEQGFLPIRFVIRNFQRRRRSLPDRPIETERVQRLVLSFTRMRPFMFRSRDSCLFNCLVLARYLAHFDVPCRWMFGVQDGPFAAHCWLAWDDRLLDDTPEHVAQYTPILEV